MAAPALDTSVPALFLADAATIELPAAAVSAEDYQRILLYAGDEAPLDGIEELLVALHDIRQILSRLAKIERVAEEVASAVLPAPGPAHAPAGPVPPGQADDHAGGSRQGVNAAAARLLATELDQGA